MRMTAARLASSDITDSIGDGEMGWPSGFSKWTDGSYSKMIIGGCRASTATCSRYGDLDIKTTIFGVRTIFDAKLETPGSTVLLSADVPGIGPKAIP